jgi:hypothetical protein
VGYVGRGRGLVTKDVDDERDYHHDEERHGGQHSGDVQGGSVLLFGRRRGDAEEVNETGGDVSEESHGSWMVPDALWTVNLLLRKAGMEMCNRRREFASIFRALATATVDAYT